MAKTCEASSSSTEAEGSAAGCFVLDRRARRLGAAGEVLLGGEPWRIVRLSKAGADSLEALFAGGGRGGQSAPVVALARRLVAGGILHPVATVRSPEPGEVAIVVPVRDDTERLRRLLEAMPIGTGASVVVVDDGSADPRVVAEIVEEAGGRLVRRAESGGPAVARNASRALVGASGPSLVAFVDSDVVPGTDFLDLLIGHFDDPRVGAVAPRVVATETTGGEAAGGTTGGEPARRRRAVLGEYDRAHSPLDLGPDPAIVGAHRRVSYVPSAVIVCRLAALEEVGWFDPDLRVGEDVDLLRRFEAAGWSTRYEPRCVVGHDSRSSLGGLLKQRFAYGSSAAALDRRHPGSVAPYESGIWSAAGAIALGVVAASLTARPARRWRAVLGGAAWLASTAIPARVISRHLASAGCHAPKRPAVATVLRGQQWAIAGGLVAIRRVFWVPLVIGAVLSKRLRRPIAGIFAVCRMEAFWPGAFRRGSPDGGPHSAPTGAAVPPAALTHAALGVADDLAYGAGVWAGCFRERTLGPLRPRLTGPAARIATGGVSSESRAAVE
jgi:mycofactocin system glycosyltransferase